ncbi:MAG: tetratricopeptide repeat protein, partial [Acutalibacteraceae bacterium]|nr:tetratricopeptide repeat protein [Acutalibacteraceae bacterium]
GEFILFGSGWGVLEEHKRAAEGGLTLSDSITLPEGALTAAQKEWLVLLYEGYLPETDPSAEPKGYVVDEFWRNLLEKSIERPENRNWYALMQMGVMEYAAGNTEKALALFKDSAAAKENAWALRNIAMIYRNELGDLTTAVKYMERAFALIKTCRGILVDTATTYLAAGLYEKWLAAFEEIGDFKNDGRLQLHKVSALIALGRYDEAREILNPDFKMPDIKEADSSLSDIWFTLYGKYVTDETGITDPAEVKALVEEKYPLGDLDFRTH